MNEETEANQLKIDVELLKKSVRGRIVDVDQVSRWYTGCSINNDELAALNYFKDQLAEHAVAKFTEFFNRKSYKNQAEKDERANMSYTSSC